jgi:hypothetical protein
MTAVAMLVYQEGDLARLEMMLNDATSFERKILTAYYHEKRNRISQQACISQI